MCASSAERRLRGAGLGRRVGRTPKRQTRRRFWVAGPARVPTHLVCHTRGVGNEPDSYKNLDKSTRQRARPARHSAMTTTTKPIKPTEKLPSVLTLPEDTTSNILKRQTGAWHAAAVRRCLGLGPWTAAAAALAHHRPRTQGGSGVRTVRDTAPIDHLIVCSAAARAGGPRPQRRQAGPPKPWTPRERQCESRPQPHSQAREARPERGGSPRARKALTRARHETRRRREEFPRQPREHDSPVPSPLSGA